MINLSCICSNCKQNALDIAKLEGEIEVYQNKIRILKIKLSVLGDELLKTSKEI